MNDQAVIQDIYARTVRIESKLSRFISGEPTRPEKVELWRVEGGGGEVELSETTVPLQAVIDEVTRGAVPRGQMFVVTVNNTPRFEMRLL